MTMYWIYDIPLVLLGLGTVATFVVVAVLGLILSRRPVARLVGPPPGVNDAVSYYFAAFGVFYGLTVGLIAVATWQVYSDADRAVGAEAATIAALYRNVSSYPQPWRRQLQSQLREYTRSVIEDAWPLQRQGIVPTGGTDRITIFQGRLYEFEPATSGQKSIHDQTLRAFDRLVELRRARLQAVTTGLPAPLWWVVLFGSALTAMSGYLFHLPRLGIHLVLTALMAALMGLLVFLIAAMDNPFRGEVSVDADVFRLVYEGLMGG